MHQIGTSGRHLSDYKVCKVQIARNPEYFPENYLFRMVPICKVDYQIPFSSAGERSVQFNYELVNQSC